MASIETKDAPTARGILALRSDEIAELVRQKVSERSLSKLVYDLNSTALSGAPDARKEALKALKHLGFCDA